MKKITLFIALIIVSYVGHSQTALGPGDIAFLGCNPDGQLASDDTFAFLLLKDIDAATTIIFTDRGWTGSAFYSGSGDGEFTWNSGISRSKGDVITLNFGTISNNAAFSGIGDQIFAIQGSIASPTFIAGLQFNDAPGTDANWDGGSTSNSTSALPSTLTNGTTAIRLIATSGVIERDNWQFRCSLAGSNPITGTAAQIRAIVNDRTNWVGTTSAPIWDPVLESGCTFTITTGSDTTDPVITCAGTPSPIVAGSNGTATIPNLVTGTTATDDTSAVANITITQSPTAGTTVTAGVHSVILTATDEAGNTDTCAINVTVNEPPSTTLSAGDIAFVGFNLDGTGSFAFVLLKDIIAGTHIRFTDCGVTNFNTISCNTNGVGGDGTATWYSNSAGSAGDVITLPGSFITGSVLASIGDQIFAYQGTSTTPTFIAGIHSNIESGTTDADWDSQNTTNDESALPDQLINGVNAIRLHDSEAEVDNWQFDCSLAPPLTGTPANIAATINNLAFWIHDDTTAYSPAAKSGCSFNVVVSSDATPPVITDCGATPADITASTLGEATVPDLTTAVVATDETTTTPNLTILQSPSAGTIITAGITTVTLYVSDEAGNTTTCTIDLTVNNIVATTLSVGDIAFVGINHDGSDSFAFVLLNNILAGTNITFTDCGITDPNTISCNGTSDTSYTWFSANDQSAGTVIELQGSSIGVSLSNLGDQLFAYQGSSASPTFIAGIHTSVITGTSDSNWDGSNSNGNTSALPDQLINGTTAVRLHSTETEVDNWQFDCALLPGGTSLNDTPANLRALINNVAYWSSNDSSEYSPAAKASCAYTVILDPIPPVAISQDYTAQLGTGGTITISGTDVDNGSSDNIGIVSYSLDVDNFDCNDIGSPVVVTLTVADAAGNTDTSTSTVTVEDNIKPTVNVQNVTIYLDANGDASTNVAAIDNGSLDNCSIATMTLDTTDFTCADVGNNVVTLTVTDVNSNVETATTTVNVVDSTVPNTIAQNISVFLDGAGNATITAADIDGGTTDNCSGLTLAASQTAFTCADIGANNVTLIATDASTNFNSKISVITVLDTIAPVAVKKNINIYLDGTGNASIVAADIDGGSTDNCGNVTLSASKTAFNCANLGPNNVTLSVDDGNGNTNHLGLNEVAVVTVLDTISPTAVAQNISVFLDGTGNASIVAADIDGGSADNCGSVTLSASKTVFTCTNLGANNVTLTATDASTNFNSKISVVTVLDTIAPVAVAQNISVFLDGTGNASIVAADIDGGTTDNCGNVTLSASKTAFNCANIGPNNVTLSVDDGNGNTNHLGLNEVAVVTVLDTISPSLTTKNITLNLNSGGSASIQANDLVLTSSDNCGTANINASKTSFNCADVGPQNIIVTVDDGNGNTMSRTAIVTVVDYIKPTVNVQNVTIYLDANGGASTNVAAIDNGSLDNCGIATMTLDTTDFTCADVGNNVVTLTVTDVNSNVETATATVNVVDSTAPNTVAQNISVFLDGAGNATITAADIDGGTTDNCSGLTLAASQTAFTCADLGPNNVTLTATDANSNSSFKNAVVTVLDTISPYTNTQNITTFLDGAGKVNIVAGDLDNGSTDNCGAVTFSASQTAFTCTDIGSNNVTLTVTDASSNTDFRVAIVTVLDTVSPTASCQNINAYLDGTGNASIVAADINGGSADNCGVITLSASTTAFTCSDLGPNNVTLTATDSSSNSSYCTAVVTVLDTISPNAFAQNMNLYLDGTGNGTITAGDIDGGSTDNCSGITLSVSQTAFTCADIGANNVTLTATDASSNTDFKIAILTVIDTISPTITCPGNQIEAPDASCNFTLPDYTSLALASDNCTASPIVTQSPAPGTVVSNDTTITLTVTDGSTNSDFCTFDVLLNDAIAPNAVAQNINTYLDSAGNATITAVDIDGGSTDNCSGLTLTASKTAFTCANLGPNNVTLTATDANSNSSFKNAVVTVLDTISPVVVFKNLTVNLNTGGNATINANDFDDGSIDNCGSTTFSASKTAFTCVDLGPQNVTIQINDGNGNSQSRTAIVTVLDDIKPTLIVQNITVELDETGTASTTYAAIDNNSFDNCDIATMTLDITNFDCDDVGENIVTLTATDVNDNVQTATATVSIEDNIKPTLIVQNITVELDETGTASTTYAAIDNNSFDNCSIATMTLDVTNFDCDDVGSNEVTFTVTDVNNNVETATATVIVQDNLPPTVVTQDISLTLDSNGNTSTTFNAIDNGSFDNCGIASMSLDVTLFTCANVGQNTVTLTVTDVNGNSASNTALVTIIDNTSPVVLTKDFTIQLDENGTASIVASNMDNGSTDNCAIASLTLSKLSFDCTNVGENIVTLTVTDNSGNSASKTAIVTIEDTIAPTISVQNVSMELDEDGVASIVVAEIDNGSLDNCDIATMTLDVTTFDCDAIGENMVTLSVTDANMNVATATATVTIIDNISPTVSVQNISVELDEDGIASVAATDIDNRSLDNCEIATMTLDVTDFDCANVGDNVVTLSVTDVNMNVSTATATVTVVDAIAPTVTVQNISVELDESGAASIEVVDIDNGSLDNCGIATMTLNLTTFDCGDIGENIVTLIVTDVNMNVATATATVTVMDNISPTVSVQNISIDLDENGLASIVATDIDNGSFDNCGAVSLSLSKTTFDCTSVGENIVTLTVTDVNMNVATATATVTVVDALAPTVIVQTISVELDEDGAASIVAADIDNGSIDNCEIATMTLDVTTFDCSTAGENDVVLTVVDVNGNSASATAIVTVVDTVMPVVSCVAPFTLSLDDTGNASISVADIDNGSIDNCGAVSLSLSKTDFTCDNIGENLVTLTVTDGSGNSAACTTVVTIVDTTAPIVVTQNISVELDEFGNANFSAADIDDDSFDACGIASMSLDVTSFSCPTLGDHTVTLTVVDVNGNSASEMAIVTFTSDDLDNDNIADVCDDDMDGDGVDNDIDNCPTTANSDQRDLDRNGIGDICDQGELEIPKGFSPNGDGANDEFIILGLHKYSNNSIQVYNRYGNMVYESKNYQNYWDGIGNKKERRLPAAPYFYVLSIDNGTRIVKGWVYINY